MKECPVFMRHYSLLLGNKSGMSWGAKGRSIVIMNPTLSKKLVAEEGVGLWW
jgi:hypothetical protein